MEVTRLGCFDFQMMKIFLDFDALDFRRMEFPLGFQTTEPLLDFDALGFRTKVNHALDFQMRRLHLVDWLLLSLHYNHQIYYLVDHYFYCCCSGFFDHQSLNYHHRHHRLS
uniref:Uncharacterized protein n=1 Tax=Pseudo-nitzschia australis TaxID=44445 RepID=A0A7S4ACR8_9STRA